MRETKVEKRDNRDPQTSPATRPKVVCIAQARMSSSRLPGKVMKEVAGHPLLFFHVSRLQRARLADEVVVATSDKANDDIVAAYCESQEYSVFRGDLNDVLKRYIDCAAAYQADLVVRTTADCPLIDPGLVDKCIEAAVVASPAPDHLVLESNHFPRGLDVEVVRRGALEIAAQSTTDAYDREHVTPFIYRHPERFRLQRHSGDGPPCSGRWCVDEEADLKLVQKIVETLYPIKPDFSWLDVKSLLEANPYWAEINRHVVQKTMQYR